MATFLNLIADPDRWDGTRWSDSLEVICDFQVTGPAGKVVFFPGAGQIFPADPETGIITAKLYAVDPDYSPATWYYRARLNPQMPWVNVQADRTGDVYLVPDTTPGVAPPTYQQQLEALTVRVEAVEDNPGGGPAYDDTELRALIATEQADREDADSALARLVADLTDRVAALEEGGTVAPTPPTHVTVEAPTKTDAAGTSGDVLHLPNQTGVIWRVNLANVAAGDVDASTLAGYPDFTVVAVADDGYALDGQTSYSFSFSTESGSTETVVWRDQFTADQDPLTMPRTPDTVGTKQWQGSSTASWIASGQARTHGPDGNTMLLGFDSWVDTGLDHHAVTFGYDFTHVPANGNAQYNVATAIVAGVANRGHRVSLAATASGMAALSGIVPGAALVFTAQNGANLSALPPSGAVRVDADGLTITVRLDGQVIATASQQADQDGGNGHGAGFLVSPYIPGTDKATYVAVSDVTIVAAA